MYPLIEVKNITKKIDHFVLGPVQLTIEPGTVLALVGDNGSGKSTLIKMMMNLVHPTEGDITAFGHNIREVDVWKQQIAYQPQTTIGYDAFNGNHLKELVSRWYPTWDENLFQRIVTDLKIPLNIRFSKLSQGVQQKLTLALTISRGTTLLILDEPMTFLDIPSKKYITNLLVEWLEQNDGTRSIILTSHHAEDIEKLADYIYLLRGGEPLGLYEKDSLIESHKRYWLNNMNRLPLFDIPGEVERDKNSIISHNTKETESFFNQHHIAWKTCTALDLEEIIALKLEHNH